MTMLLLPLVLTVTAPPNAAAAQQPPAMPVSGAADTQDLTLDWPAGTALSVETDGPDTIVRFDRGPDAAALDAFRRQAGADLIRMDWNDTSMVIRPAPGRTFMPRLSGDRLTIRVVRDPSTLSDAAAEPIDFALAQVAAEAAAGYPGRARRRWLAIDRDRPGDPQVARTLADADSARGATARAAQRYRALGATDAYARRAIRAGGGEATANAVVRDGGGFTQAEATLRITAPVLVAPTGIDAVVGAGLRRVHTRADAVVTPVGTTGTLRRGTTLAEITGSVGNAATRLELLGAANLSNRRVGLAGRLFHGPAEREWRLIGAWHLPDVLTAEQVLLGGYVDRWGAGATVRVSPALVVQGDAIRTSYGLNREGRRATTTVVAGGLDVTVRRLNPALTLLYRLEAEYVDRLSRRPGGAASLPLVDRENHTAQALVAQQLGAWRLAAAAGWTVDRFGGNGPTATLTATGLLGDAWQVEAAGGVSSIQRPNLVGTQLFARVGLRRSLGHGL